MLQLLSHYVLLFMVFADLNCKLPTGFNVENIKEMLRYHNDARSQMAKGMWLNSKPTMPTATNIRRMAWSCELEKSAQQEADSLLDCSIPHYSPTGGKTIMAFKKNTTEEYGKWWLQYNFNINCRDELRHLSGSQLIPKTHNYRGMQRIWWNTDKLGCGYAPCRDRQWRQAFVVVCHYNPAGNIPGERAYEPGETCSNCGIGFKCDNITEYEEGLCVYLCSGTCPAGNGAYNEVNKQAILDAHNIPLRSPIAKGTFTAKGKLMPPATNMRKMIWNCTLEKSAQDYANKCIFEHSGGSYGENLYESWSSAGAPPVAGSGKAASDAWASEFQMYGWPNVELTDASFSTGIGHATQMAWWSSNTIGCGAAQCQDSSKNFTIVVCQYYPRGNIVPSDNYEAGKTCSNCGSGFTCETATGLCVQTGSGR